MLHRSVPSLRPLLRPTSVILFLSGFVLSAPRAGAQDGPASADPGASEPLHSTRSSASPGATSGVISHRRQVARDLAFWYLDLWSAPNSIALASVASFYEASVKFHGRDRTLKSVLAEKRSFAARWPGRDYRYRPGTTFVGCDEHEPYCTVWSLFDFAAVGPRGLRRSSGLGEHELVISFAGKTPTIISENSRVLRRGVLHKEPQVGGSPSDESVPSSGSSAALVACERAIAEAARLHGGTQVSVADVEPETTDSTLTSLRFRARIEYRDGERRQVRTARVDCRLGENGRVIAIR
jgi:hypothetical protein